jgi:hypothetical protein
MIEDLSESGPVVVGVDGSERSVYALALAELLGPRVVIAYVHPDGNLSSVFSGVGSTSARGPGLPSRPSSRFRPHLPSVPESRMQLVSEDSPRPVFPLWAEGEAAALILMARRTGRR